MFQFRRGPIRGLVALSIIAAAATGGVASAQATAEAPSAISAVTLRYNIPAQDLTAALTAFAHQSRAELIYAPDAAEGRQSATLNGAFSAVEAVEQILQGTGLDFVVTDGGGIMIGEPDVVAEYRRRLQNSSTGNLAVAQAKALADDASPTDAPLVDIDSARRAGVEEIIVTGQKKAERLQDVPIAISAFSMDQLDAQKIEGGFDLLKAIPNVTFSKTNFSGYNFQIRGIGTQAISATTDPGVAVSMNNTTLIVNRLFEQEYLDMERVEVLRGPQGTLFGRNATAGVINVITAKPELGIWGGELKAEAGNYGAERLRGHVNLPLYGDVLAARVAFASTRREGYGTNLAAGERFVGREAPSSESLDNRDLWTGRISLGWQPGDRLRANLIYERFEEDDHRLRTSKQLCHRDPGETLMGEPLIDLTAQIPAVQDPEREAIRYSWQLSQGCLPGSLFDEGDPADPEDNGAYGVPMGDQMPFVRAIRGLTGSVRPIREGSPDLLAGAGAQSRDLRSIFSPIEPEYRAQSELAELSLDVDLGDGLTLSSQTVYMENDLFSTQDFLRFETRPEAFIETNLANYGELFHVMPDGVFIDPQLGAADRLLIQDVSQQVTRQFSQELRLVSSFDGPLNFSVGVNYTRFENTADYFVFSNALTMVARMGIAAFAGSPVLIDDDWWLISGRVPPGVPAGSSMTVGCGRVHPDALIYGEGGDVIGGTCVLIQDGDIDQVRHDPQGHNFFVSRNPYELSAAGLFGELYYDITPALKLTAGLRLNWDRKTFTPIPSQTLLPDWRGRAVGGFLGSPDLGMVDPLGPVSQCDPRVSSLVIEDAVSRIHCASGGINDRGAGYTALPDIVQEWRVPTGRVGVDWKADLGVDWVDETLLYAFYTRGYKAGGANPPGVSATQGLLIAAAQGAAALPTFSPEYVNALEVGTKNTLFGGAVQLSGNAFYYDYEDYQVSKIVDRSAANENFDATIWGVELESLFAVSADTLLNAAIGYLRTKIADGERSLDLMDRTQSGGADHYIDRDGDRHELQWDEWVVVKPNPTQASNCVAPREVVRDMIVSSHAAVDILASLCPGGRILAASDVAGYNPFVDAPNGAAGFFAEIGGNELPNAPRFTVSLGAQHTLWLRNTGWSATGRVDWYWQDESFHRVYNTEYDQLRDWTNTNISFWVSNERIGLTVEAYVKNVFDETPVTGAFLNSDDTGLSTNVFTLDPRLVGLSVRKRF
jgi:iron complex outermembrane recepter protein